MARKPKQARDSHGHFISGYAGGATRDRSSSAASVAPSGGGDSSTYEPYSMVGNVITGGPHRPQFMKKKEAFKSAPLARGGAMANISAIGNIPFSVATTYMEYGKKQYPKVKEFFSDKPYSKGDGPVYNKERKEREEYFEDRELERSDLKHRYNPAIEIKEEPPCKKPQCLKLERKIGYKIDNSLKDTGRGGKPAPTKVINERTIDKWTDFSGGELIQNFDTSPGFFSSSRVKRMNAPKLSISEKFSNMKTNVAKSSISENFSNMFSSKGKKKGRK